MPKTFKFLKKWPKFAKSGHTAGSKDDLKETLLSTTRTRRSYYECLSHHASMTLKGAKSVFSSFLVDHHHVVVAVIGDVVAVVGNVVVAYDGAAAVSFVVLVNVLALD